MNKGEDLIESNVDGPLKKMLNNDSEEESVASSICSLVEANVLKDVVPPLVYSTECKISMHVFLKDFEGYFSLKYVGTDRDRCRILGKFLEGEARDVYDVLGGTHLPYSKVKENILVWYDSQQMVWKQQAKYNFNSAKLQEGESFTLYCLRLETLAALAYPNSCLKAFKKLKKHLLHTLPDSLVESIEDRIDLKNAISLGSITWSDILDIASKHDEKLFKKSNKNIYCNVTEVQSNKSLNSSTIPSKTNVNFASTSNV